MSGDHLDLDAIEARSRAATDGPWKPETWVDQFGRRYVLSGGHGNYEVERLSIMSPSDAEFIAHARDDVPALVAEVRRLREERDALDLMDWPGEAHRLNAALQFAKGTINDMAQTIEILEADLRDAP